MLYDILGILRIKLDYIPTLSCLFTLIKRKTNQKVIKIHVYYVYFTNM